MNRATRSRSRVDDRLQDDHFFIMEVRTAAQLLEADWQLKFTVRRCRVESWGRRQWHLGPCSPWESSVISKTAASRCGGLFRFPLTYLIRPLSPAQSVARAINHDQDVQAVKFVVQQTSFGRGRRGLWPFILIGAFTSADWIPVAYYTTRYYSHKSDPVSEK